MSTFTNTAILERFNIDTSALEFPDLEVPVLSATQRQGDVLARLLPDDRTDRGEEIPAKGVLVVRGETTGGNSHILHALTGTCYWAPNPRADQEDELVQGWLTVPEGSEAVICHEEEHGVIGLGPGVFEFRRQREFRSEWEKVQD